VAVVAGLTAMAAHRVRGEGGAARAAVPMQAEVAAPSVVPR
jgi:hypothetical protein